MAKTRTTLLTWTTDTPTTSGSYGTIYTTKLYTPQGPIDFMPLEITIRGPIAADPYFRISRGRYSREGNWKNLQNEQKKGFAGKTEEEVTKQVLLWFEDTYLTPMQRMSILTTGLSNPKYVRANPRF